MTDVRHPDEIPQMNVSHSLRPGQGVTWSGFQEWAAGVESRLKALEVEAQYVRERVALVEAALAWALEEARRDA